MVRTMADAGVLGGVSLGRLYPGEESLANGLVVAVTETTTRRGYCGVAKRLAGGAGMSMNRERLTADRGPKPPKAPPAPGPATGR